MITAEKSVFDRHDIARTLHHYINDDAQAYQNAFASVMASPALVQLQAEQKDRETGDVLKARYSTREMIGTESGMMQATERLHQTRNHGVDRRHVARTIARQDETIQKSSGDVSARLSDEQRQAIEYVTGRERIAAVVGFAGAGKSTMLAAAREAWEAQGYKVYGAALKHRSNKLTRLDSLFWRSVIPLRWRCIMGRFHSLDIRERIVSMVDGGQSRRAAARHFCVRALRSNL